LGNPVDFEFAEALRNIHRIAEIRLNDKLGVHPDLGQEVWDWHEWLAQFSDPGFAERGELTVTYLTPAHQACAKTLTLGMQACGFDEVHTDAVGNVVGVYHGASPKAQTLAHRLALRHGAQWGQVRRALGHLGAHGLRARTRPPGPALAHGIEVVAFAEEEGQRYRATFLGSGALVGQFNPAWLDQTDADGIAMREAMAQQWG
jgi:beta-ureidopropionase / N-carbamoyl-L-amino-acid hydrolase